MHRRLPTLAQRAANIRGFAIAIIMALVFLTIPYSETSRLSVSAQALSYVATVCELSNAGTLGDGSEADPWQISTSDQLFAIQPCKGDPGDPEYFELIADIDAASAGAGVPTNSPIGSLYGDSPQTATLVWFGYAVLDGKGHEISYSMALSDKGAGLFRDLRNVTFSNLVLRGSAAYTGTAQTAGDSAGALAVKAQDSSFLAITNHVEVSGFKVVGGLVGYADRNMTVHNSVNYGTISASSQYAGGLFGQLRGGSGTATEVASFSNYAAITAADYGAGGAIGQLTQFATANFTNVSNFGEISVSDATITGWAAGGLIGDVQISSSVNFDSVRNAGTVSAAAHKAGGLIGLLASGTSSITNSVNEGAVTATAQAGGLLGYVSSGLEIRDSSNTGAVTGGVSNYGHGGIFGYGDAYGKSITISNVVNSGDVNGYGDVGGIFGYGDGILTLYRVHNLGEITGTGTRVGGLIGQTDTDNLLAIDQSINSGTVSSAADAGGLLGTSDGNLQMVDSYNSGKVTGGANSGLVGHSTDTTNNSVSRVLAAPTIGTSSVDDGFIDGWMHAADISASFTFTESAFISTSSLAELKLVSTYVDAGWDFDTVWGFGGCDLNSGYPVLRWAHAGTTFFDQSCGVNSSSSPVVSSGSSGGSAPAPTRTPTAYAGPILDASRVVVEPGTTHTLSGKRLQTIHTVRIEGLNAAVLILTSTSLTITLPASLTPGTYDLVVFSAHGKLTVNAKFEVVKAKKVIDAETEEVTDPGLAGSRTFGVLLGFQWSARFTGNSRDLSQMQVRGVSESLEGYPAATTVVCWGYTTETTPGDWAIEHATKRAEGLCNAVAGLREDVKLHVRVRFGQSKFAAMRATMQFWESKQPI